MIYDSKTQCVSCNKKISPKDKDYCIISDSWVLCTRCLQPKVEKVIEDVESFRKTINFFNEKDVYNILINIKERLGNWIDLDNGKNLKDLQITLISNQISLVETLIERYGLVSRKKIREELLDIYDKLLEDN